MTIESALFCILVGIVMTGIMIVGYEIACDTVEKMKRQDDKKSDK